MSHTTSQPPHPPDADGAAALLEDETYHLTVDASLPVRFERLLETIAGEAGAAADGGMQEEPYRVAIGRTNEEGGTAPAPRRDESTGPQGPGGPSE